MMSVAYGGDARIYKEMADWAQLPDGWTFREVVDVAVDAQDRVYVFTRGDHPVIIFEQDGRFVESWGEGLFVRPHGVTITLDADGTEVLYCVDDDGHWIGKFTLDGTLLSQIGQRGEGAPAGSGDPFNRPTKVALDPKSGDLYISDGYGNARVHKYTADGRHLFSWGDYGTDPGEFNLPHSVCTDSQGEVYVADRENHRIQMFDEYGNYLDQWNNMHRPCGLCIRDDIVYVGQLPSHLDVNADYPNIGACVSVYDTRGRRLALIGAPHSGTGPEQYTAPHGIAVDSRGDIYVGEVSYTAHVRRLGLQEEVRSFRKLSRRS
jgi:DNA-binding beta-propeller fold protein YncE